MLFRGGNIHVLEAGRSSHVIRKGTIYDYLLSTFTLVIEMIHDMKQTSLTSYSSASIIKKDYQFIHITLSLQNETCTDSLHGDPLVD